MLAWTGTDSDDVAESKLGSLRRLVLLTLACESWVALRYVPYSSEPGLYGLLAALLTATALLGWRDRFALPATGFAFLLEASSVLSTFPENANHQFLALVLLLLLLLALAGRREGRDEEGPNAVAALQAARWIAAIGLAWAGVMKIYYGYWFEGEFLAFRIAHDPGFARFFSFVMPASELTRLTSLGHELGAGPFRADAPMLVWISNLTWVAELVLPVGLLFARTQLLAVIGSIALLIAIELGAREIFFGGIMLGLLLCFLERDRLAPALPWIGVVYALWMLHFDLAGWLGRGGAA